MDKNDNSAIDAIHNLEKKIDSKKINNKKIIKNTEAKRKNLKSALIYFKILIFIILAGYFYSLIPQITLAFQPLRPLRMGTYQTDKATDKCIENIWKIASGNSKKTYCPVSKAPYKETEKGIYCPNPEKHGFKNIYFDKSKKHVMVKINE
jgi:hypothetical protein